MRLLTPAQTPYDVNFRLGEIHVRIHPGFWIVQAVIAAMFASGAGGAGVRRPVFPPRPSPR